MSSSITNLKKKRKNRTLRSGKKVKASKELSQQLVTAAIYQAIDECKGEILRFGRDCYADGGERGVIHVTVKDHPNNPFKRGPYYYVTEADNDAILANQKVITDDDRRIAESIRTYNPHTQAIVIVWHGLKYVFTTIRATPNVFPLFINKAETMVH